MTARLEPKLKAGREEMKGDCKEIIAGQERVLAKMGFWLVKMKSTGLLASQEEIEIVVERPEVLNEQMND
jgi:hypothetical protein